MDEVLFLRSQLVSARNELQKLRKDLKSLKIMHENDIKKIRILISQTLQPQHEGKKATFTQSYSHKSLTSKEIPKSNWEIESSCTEIQNLTFTPIGNIKSVFRTKNAIPRQPGVCDVSRATLTIDRTVFNNPEHSLQGLQDFSHVWIIFHFHKNNNSCVKAKIRPPRLNGRKVGMFSTRCPYRPNPIGLSLVKLDQVSGSTLYLSGIDLLDGTPVLDIKPYIPEYDHVSPPHTKSLVGENQPNPDTNNILKDSIARCTEQVETSFGGNKVANIAMADVTYSQKIQAGSACLNPVTKDMDDEAPAKVHSTYSVPVQTGSTEGRGSDKCDETNLPLTREKDILAYNSAASKTSECEKVQIADWVTNPPIAKLEVRFTRTALEQLQLFSKELTTQQSGSCYTLNYINNIEEVQKSITNILQNDPRSIYRRKKCADRLYYFSVDTVHITCWFDDAQNTVEVVKLQPTTAAELT